MKTVWKWVIGIVVVLVIIAVLVGGAFLLRNHLMNVVGVARLNRPGLQVPGTGTLPPTNNGNGTRRFPGMMPFGYGGWGGRGMMGYGRMMPFGGLFGGLISLGVLALIVLAIIWLVMNLRKPSSPAMAVAAVNPVVPAVATHPCPKCGESVQEDWKFCPHCGEKL
jgi:hypothetical protein